MPDWGESPQLDPSLRTAAQHLAAGETEEALATLAPVLSSEAPPLAGRFLLGILAWRMGRLDWALELVRQCHELDPMDGAVAEAYASLLAQSGNLVECVYLAKIGTALGSTGPLAEFVPPDFPTFEAAFRKIDERPKLAQAKRDRAAGAFDDALESARQHVALAPGDVEGRALHAALLLEARRAGDAVDTLRPVEDDALESAPLASLYGRCLAACGEHGAARRWHDEAERLQPADAAIAAARIADGMWLDAPSALAERGALWARRFCPQPKPRAWRKPEGRLVISYFVTALADPDDCAAITAVARAHDRRATTVLAYATGAQSWRGNLRLSGVFDRWQDVGALDGATLARYLAHDGVDVVIDACGFSSPQNLLALARVGTALRVSWLGNPAALMAPCFDARIVAGPGADEASLWHVAGGYPVPEARPMPPSSRNGLQFGADIVLPQLDDDTLAVWCAALDTRPEAKLLLRTPDMSPGAIDRLVARFGRERAARIDIVTAERFEDFYARIDLALLPRRGLSPRSAAEATACGVPALAYAGANAIEPYGVPLRSWGGAHIAADGADYVRQARDARSRTGAVAAFASDAASFARAIEEHALAALSLGAAA